MFCDDKKKMVFDNKKIRFVFICSKNMEKIFYEENFTHNINLYYINQKK